MKSVRWLVVAVAAVMLALTGCTTPSANIAATVNGVPIHVTDLDAQVKAVANTSAAVADLNAAVLTTDIRGIIARQLATENNIDLSPAVRSQALASPDYAQFAALANDPAAKPFVEALVDTNLVVAKIGAQAFLDRVAKTDVQVNPRYGSWSVQSAAVSQSGSQLSQPWATPTPPA